VSYNLVADLSAGVFFALLAGAVAVFANSLREDHDMPTIRKLEVSVFLALVAFIILPIGFGFRIAGETTRAPGRSSLTGAAYLVIFLAILPLIWLAASKRFRPVVTALVLASGFAILLETFALVYWSHGTSRNFSIPLSHFDAFYFALGTLTTGTGNISAMSEASRRIQTTQLVIDLVFIGFIVALLMARYSTLFDRPPPGPTGEGLVTQLVEGLRAAAEQESNPERKTQLQQAVGLLGGTVRIPTGEGLVTQLVEGLRAAAEQETNPERKTQLQQAADLLGDTVRNVVVDVAAEVVGPG
jgi:hypothetical protein